MDAVHPGLRLETHTQNFAVPVASVRTRTVRVTGLATTPAGCVGQKVTVHPLKSATTVAPATGLLAMSRTITSKQQVPSGPAVTRMGTVEVDGLGT